MPITRNKGGRPIGTTAAGSLAEARRRKEWALAALRETELARRRGALLDADVVADDWARVLRQVRAAVMAVPSRLRDRLPHLTPQEVQLVDAELRATLEALATAPVRDDDGAPP